MALGQLLYGGMDLTHGGDAEVGDVHADLGAAVGEYADGLDPVQTTVGGADVAGDGPGGGDVGLVEMDVVGDQKAARSDDTGSGSFMEFGTADVGAAGGVALDGIAEALKLAAANIFKLDTVWPGGRGSVEVDGDAVATPDEEAGLTGRGRRTRRGRLRLTGMNGMTSAAPMRGWTPFCLVRSISSAALPAARTADSTTASGEPAMVTTERLCAASSDQSRRLDAFHLHGGDDLADFGDVCSLGKIGDALDDGFRVHDSIVMRIRGLVR